VTTTSAVSSSAAQASSPAWLHKVGDTATVYKYGKKARIQLPIYVVAGDQPLDVRATRASYSEPIRSWVEKPTGAVPLPDGLHRSWRRLDEFMHIQIRDRAGDLVLDRTTGLCPVETYRFSPDAPSDVSTYPQSCPTNPYTLGAVYGIDAGWAAPAFGWGFSVALPLGRYTIKAWIDPDYRDAIGATAADTTVRMPMRIVQGEDFCDYKCKTRAATPSFAVDGPSPVTPSDGATDATGPHRTAVADEPAGREPRSKRRLAAVGTDAQPDLRSLPAWAIKLSRTGYLRFAANVWNAGPSTLVIDGFRRDNEDLMDAYQYFYDADGTKQGHQWVGTMEWDAKRGHHHWHFRDFARYRLLDADKQAVVRSHKEAFCLANTDAVVYTVPGANWRPWNTDLHTACGGFNALSLREVLDVGSGDTYYQTVAGQSFNVKRLPNGVYYIAVEANPMHRLVETDLTNNVSYRKLRLGGRGDGRWVKVYPAA